MSLQPGIFLTLYFLVLRVAAWDCTALQSLKLPNASISDTFRVTAGSTFNTSADPTCFQPTYNNTVAICRVIGTATTSSTSSVSFEMWLPDTWYGRVLTGGNGGLGGCIGYPILDQGSALNFATIATNAGHDGNFDPSSFLMPSRVESITDFSYRAVQVAAVLGKKVAAVYYGVKPHHSYYNGCSAGGRQGISVASRYPDLFDGVVAGSPAVDWNRFLGAPAIWASYVAANTSSAISLPLWDSLVALEVLRQCDGIDGKVDGVITDPTLCKWNPHTLLCGPGQDAIACLTQPQIDGLKKLYQPILGTKGDVVFSPYDPGAEADITVGFPMNGIVSPFTVDWYNYAIYGQPARPFDNFSVADMEYTDTVDPVGISTWSNAVEGLGEYRKKGGKVVTFHGTRDPSIPSGHSKAFYDLLSSGLHSENGNLEDFYRLFMIPGMGHCLGGPGAWRIGQGTLGGVSTNGVNKTDHSVLLSLVEWVEGEHAPEFVIGTDAHGQERKHCLWPTSKSVWDGENWDCVDT